MPIEKLPTPHEVMAMTVEDREEIMQELSTQIDADQKAATALPEGRQRDELWYKIQNYQQCLRFCRVAESQTIFLNEKKLS